MRILAVALALFVGGACGAEPSVLLWSEQSGPFLDVARVIDGDTFILASGDRVRLIGVDTPETVHPRRPAGCFGQEASEFLHRLLAGPRVRIEADGQRPERDRYGRLLAYVFLEAGGLHVNAEILRVGLGEAYTRYPFDRRAEFVGLERDARRERRGRWGAPGDEEECLRVFLVG